MTFAADRDEAGEKLGCESLEVTCTPGPRVAEKGKPEQALIGQVEYRRAIGALLVPGDAGGVAVAAGAASAARL